jgi:hypothetical protein
MNNPMQSHRQVWEMLPWIANGSASEEEAQSAQEHLRSCADCREAWAFEQRVREALLQARPTIGDAEQDWQRLSARIDGSPTVAKSRRETEQRSWPVRWLAAAVIVEALALGAIVTSSWVNRSERDMVGTYRTLSQPDAQRSAATIRVVLAPEMTLSQFRGLLESAHLQVVAGPGESGVWALAPAQDADSAATEAALRQLRDSPQVRFAEPINGGAHAPPR